MPSVQFPKGRWDEIRQNHTRWWDGELKRPLILLHTEPRDPGRSEPKLPSHPFASYYDMSVSAEDIVDRWDYDLSCRRYLGDAYPSVSPDFGPGSAAAILGARLVNSPETGTVWFDVDDVRPMAGLSMKWDPDNVWLRRIKDLYRAAVERWQGAVQLDMTDLGGTLDVLQTFRPSDRLALDLYDDPESTRKRIGDVHDLWWKCFDELNAIIKPVNPGSSGWLHAFCAGPYYNLQCDFAHMISPEMFDEVVKPELASSAARLEHALYHLDGPGQIVHLDSILSIDGIDGIQWVPGSGSPDRKHWPDLYRKIRDAGKKIHIGEGIDTFETIVEQLGGWSEGIIFEAWPSFRYSVAEVESFLAEYRAK